MQKYQIPLPLPTAGINYRDDSLIADDEAAEGTVNISFKNGQPRTRKGYLRQGLYDHMGESNDITRLYVHTVAGVRRMVFAVDAATKKLYQFNPGKSPIRRDLGDIYTSKPGLISFAGGFPSGAYSEKTLVLTGMGFYYYDETVGLTPVPAYVPTPDEVTAHGTNVLTDAVTEIAQQKWIVNDDNRYWIAGYGNLVRISHLDNSGAQPAYWPSLQAMKLPEDCTGMARYMGEVILFTENTATIVTGSTPVMSLENSYQSKVLPGGYGCSQAETIAIGDNSLYWANRNGVYRYTYMPSGFSIPECVSEFAMKSETGILTRSIKKRLSAITDWSAVFAVFYDHEYRLYLGDGDVLCFDSIMSSWALYHYANEFTSGVVYGDELYYGAHKPATDFSRIYRMDYPFDDGAAGYDGLSDDGVAFTTILRSKMFDFNKAANKKRFTRLYFTLYSDMITFNVNVDVNMDNEQQIVSDTIVSNTVSRWGNNDPADDLTEGVYAFKFGDTLSGEQTNFNFPVKMVHRGKKYNIQYVLTSSGLNNAWLLQDVVLMMKVKELR